MNQNTYIPVGKHKLSAFLLAASGYLAPVETRTTLAVMIHSFPGSSKAGHGDMYGDLEHELGRDGLSTLRFDFRGCGESQGRPQDFTFKTAQEDLEAALKWANKEKGYNRFFLIAEGLGAAVALHLAEHEMLRGMVMLWPVLDPKQSVLNNYLHAPDDGEERGGVEINGCKTGRDFLKEAAMFDPLPLLEKMTVPVLVQHGEADAQASVGQLDLIRDHMPNTRRVEITTYQGGMHGLPGPKERKTMYYHVRQFVKRYI